MPEYDERSLGELLRRLAAVPAAWENAARAIPKRFRSEPPGAVGKPEPDSQQASAGRPTPRLPH